MSSRINEIRTYLPILLTTCMTVVLACGTKEPQEAVITIDSTQRFQTLVGWEATAQAGQSFASFPGYRNRLVSDSVNELGINRLRVEVRSGSENTMTSSPENRKTRYEIVNDNDDPFLINDAGFKFDEMDEVIERLAIPMKKALSERGEGLLINLNYVDFGASDFEHKEHPEEYAEFILAAFLHMNAKFGFVPDTVELILEPDTDNASWSAKQIAEAAVATSARLKANGFKPAFVTPSTTDAANALKYIDEIAAHPGALDPIVEFSYHRYSGVSDDVLKGIGERGTRHGKRTSMLEWISADQDTLHDDLKLANVSAWQQYTLAFSGKDDGGAYYKIDSEDAGVIRMGRRTKYLRQYFRCLRPGAVRIEASTSNENFDPVAFEKNDSTVSVVIKTEGPGHLVVRDLPAGRYFVSHATEDSAGEQPVEHLIDPGMQLKVSIPSAGVLTVCSQP